MFVRKKKNKSGIVSVQVIDKSSGRYKVIRTIGSSKDPDKVEEIYNQGLEFIQTYQGQQMLTFPAQDFKEALKNSIKSINIEGINLLLGQIYSSIGLTR